MRFATSAILCAAVVACAGTRAVECGPVPANADARSTTMTATGIDSARRRWTFDAPIGQPPSGFDFAATGGAAGKWVVRQRADAPSPPAVVAQEDSSRTASRFALALATGATFGEVDIAVRCFPYGGQVDRACGLVWRAADAQNYYLARANALEDNVRFYYVQNGSRHEIASWSGSVSSCAWHTLRVRMRGNRVEVFWDGQSVIDTRDDHFSDPGRIGLWTKADSRTFFDDLVAAARP